MMRIFASADPRDPERALLDAAATKHLRARRLRVGDRVIAMLGPNDERIATIAEIGPRGAVLHLGPRASAAERHQPDAEVPCTLAVALADLSRFDWLIEKATELGASHIRPFVARRSQLHELSNQRLRRWERIARVACEQCGRTNPPAIEAPCSLGELAQACAAPRTTLLLTPSNADAAPLPGVADAIRSAGARLRPGGLVLIIGPEGGLTPTEQATLVEAGAVCVNLRGHTLRFETAAIAALAIARDAIAGAAG